MNLGYLKVKLIIELIPKPTIKNSKFRDVILSFGISSLKTILFFRMPYLQE
jgi:hypothetical protein